MRMDLRDSKLFREAADLCEQLRRPGTGQLSDAADVSVAPDGHSVVFSGTIVDKLEGTFPTRICRIDLSSGDTRVLTYGPNVDRLPKYSPDGSQIAFLSDRRKAGDFQLYLLDSASCGACATPRVDGWVEYFHWSPDSYNILLGVAGDGADLPSGQGAITRRPPAAGPSWIPRVDNGHESNRRRRLWLYDLATRTMRPISEEGLNVWEANWCGAHTIAAIASAGPAEGLWYAAPLRLIEVGTGNARTAYTSPVQLGVPAASPSGKLLGFIESISSDRWIVAGSLRLMDVNTQQIRTVNTGEVDVTYIEWRSESHLLVAGHRRFETVVGLYSVHSNQLDELWCSHQMSAPPRYITVSGFGDQGDCALITESFTRAPEVGVIQNRQYQSKRSFDLGYVRIANVIGAVDMLQWSAPDGLKIEGWLLRPAKHPPPYPLVMHVHGGPVSHWRPRWLGRAGVPTLLLLKRGYAIFYPNPRGSSGYGQEFAGRIVGDIGGADTYDLLSGLDHLVKRGLADPKRIGVMGGSYGGYMTSWLITQDIRFAAAVSVSPSTNKVSQRLLSNLPQFVDLFTGDRYDEPNGKYFTRSPIMHARKAKTPTLNICGALDRCTPPEEAMQFHNALLENGVPSALVVYPEEGHGVNKFPASLDYAARVANWFEQYMPSDEING